VVLLAYLIGWWRVRGRFPLQGAIPVAAGAVVGLAWWAQNLIRYGTLQPNGFSTQFASYAAPPRTPATPFVFRDFAEMLWHNYPTRFWGQLGELEPPYLPVWLLVILSVTAVIGFVLLLVLGRGYRWTTTILFAVGVGVNLAVLLEGLNYTLKYDGTTGLQARYALPMCLGLLLPMALGFGLLLRRYAVWWSVVMAALGITATITSYVVWINRMMLPKGSTLAPGNVHRALTNIARFFPFPTPVTAVLVLLVAAGLALVLVYTVLVAIRSERHRRSGPAREGSRQPAVA
jgi:hypothetical protein